jgi:hypothetical protein
MQAELSATERGCETLPLTVTRRCGKAIVAEARKIVPDFEAHEDNSPGVVIKCHMDHEHATTRPGHYATRCIDGDFVLCRVNAPLVSECFRFLRSGRKATIQGRDIGKGLISTIKKFKAADVLELTAKLDNWLSLEMKKENAKKFPSEARLIALQDRHDCLSCFISGAETIDAVIAKIESVFADKICPSCKKPYKRELTTCYDCKVELVLPDGVRLSSIHKAKGLEANTVYFLRPKGGECPHPMAKSDWQKKQEMNLLYVAITRAIKELVYVS